MPSEIFRLDDFPVPSLIADFSGGAPLRLSRQNSGQDLFSREEAAKLLAAGRLVAANQSALDLLQLSSLRALMTFRRAFRGEMISWLQDALSALVRGEDSSWSETTIYRRDGQPVPVIGRARAIGGKGSSLARVLWSFIDVSELKAAEAAALEAQHAAEQANQSKSRFLAMMSHEIRTPLNGVLGMAQLLMRKELPAQERDMVGVILQSGDALLAILNDLLDVAKLEAGKLSIESVPFDLTDVVTSAFEGFRAVAVNKNLGFELEISSDLIGLWRGDPTRIRQILHNLVSNALKFTDHGEVRVCMARTAQGVVLTVSDTGIGIPADKLAPLFDSFVQADETVARRYGGTGLGLSICRELAGLMGGEVSAQSVAGQGSIFTVLIPLTAWEEGPVPQDFRTTIIPQTVEPMRVLVAEDNAVNQLLLTAMLAPLNLDLAVVSNGQKALDALAAGPFDLVLMDVQMPEMDGVTAVRHLRERERCDHRAPTPVIAVTANVMPTQIAEYRAAGMSGWIEKPIRVPDLVAEMNRVRAEGA